MEEESETGRATSRHGETYGDTGQRREIQLVVNKTLNSFLSAFSNNSSSIFAEVYKHYTPLL